MATISESKLNLRLPRLSGTARVWMLTGVVATSAATLFLARVLQLQPLATPVHIPWWALTAMFALAEVFVVHLQFRRDAHSLSLSEIALVLGLFFSTPSEFVVAQALGAGLALAFAPNRRQSPLKLAFNTSHLALEACIATLIFHNVISVVGADQVLGPGGWMAAAAAALAATTTGALMIVIAISLSEGRRRLDTLSPILSFGTLVTITNTGLALIGVSLLWRDPRSAWLLVIPTGILFLAYRLYMSEREKHASLESLYASTRSLQQSLKVDAAIVSLLSQTREMFHAEIAEIVLFPSDEDEEPLRTTLGPGDKIELMQPMKLDATQGVWARVTAEQTSLLLPRPIANERLRDHYEMRNVRDLMVAPLKGETGTRGVIQVANRLGDVSTFDTEDLKLFETLAHHASASLENARLVSQLEESLEHLKEMNQLKDDFVASVSHELRTPLTSIQGYVKTLLRPGVEWEASQQRDFLEAVDRQSDRLRSLIEDLLAVSRIESSGESPVLAEVSLPEIIDQTLEELRDRANSHRVEVACEQLPLVLSDRGKVHQVISNLVDNALKYSPPQSTVVVAAQARSAQVVVSVQDQGTGVPIELREEIFERFYQVDQSSTRTVGGTGLGLYICRKLAAAVGGSVWLDHSDGSGSRFCFAIPIRPPDYLVRLETPRPAAVG